MRILNRYNGISRVYSKFYRDYYRYKLDYNSYKVTNLYINKEYIVISRIL